MVMLKSIGDDSTNYISLTNETGEFFFDHLKPGEYTLLAWEDLNENNFSNEDCIMITRSFLLKSKKILKLSSEFKSNKNIDLTISSAKPPIFWKDKEITKQQIYKWTPENIRKLIYSLNEIELLVKKNINNSINLITDFILDQSSSNTNN